ncbi:von Willebrand factor type A [Pyrolobus fumarii 1A]|uniref:von Willebrand factor type A n=1 Tax=Pyrolobus fumarii (strain DSM 11204 / 1A) TaxID=694429 RepID=G0EEA8_PYRF1|nr:vWA domain-containing protein [Pyrolobus fumarii]AEM38802.1 von Willebrand factor type A [Pyrolobus fumarii 1A]
MPRIGAAPTRALMLVVETDRDAIVPQGARVGFVAEIYGRRAERAPTFLIVLLDVSPSMKKEGKIIRAKEGVMEAMKTLKPTDHFAVIAFCRTAKLVGSTIYGDSLEDIKRKVDEVKHCTFTNIGRALEEALNLIEALNKRYGAIYTYRILLLTDGMPTWGPKKPEHFSKIIERARKLGAPIIAIGIGREYNEKLLFHLAKETGGVFEHVTSAEEIRRVLEEYAAKGTKVVAKDVKLEIELYGNVDLEVYGFRYERKGSKAIVHVGDISEGEQVTVAGMLIVFPMAAAPGAKMRAARFRVSYYEPMGGERMTAWIDLTLRVVESEEQIKVDEVVAAKVNALSAAQKIVEAAMDGRAEELLEATARLAEETARIGDMELYSETMRIKEMLEARADEAVKEALSLASKIVKRTVKEEEVEERGAEGGQT